jgi:folate-binding protein YgfZ
VAAYFHLLRRGAEYVLLLPRSTAPAAGELLRKMIFRSQVALRDATGDLIVHGLAGEPAAALVEERAGRPLSVPGAAADAGDVSVLRVPGLTPRFELLASRGAVPWAAPTAGPEAWELADVAAGEPAVYPQTAEAFLPQFLDLDRRGGLSFKKGCFPGQEVVARTQHLGDVKRRLALAHVVTDRVPEPGEPLRVEREDGDRDGGTVVRAAPGPEGGVFLLAVVPVAERESGRAIHLGRADGPALAFRELPERDW